MAADSTLTLRELWAQTASVLGERTHARWLCEVACGIEGDEFLAVLDEPATQRMVAHVDAMMVRREAGEPLQYVLGRWQFRTLDLMIDRRVLIPRPETEWVCEAALQTARPMIDRSSALTIVDLGTGSGAIGLSIAAELPRGTATVWLTDSSPEALDVASANLAGLGVSGESVTIAHGAWFEALPPALAGTIDLIVTNPPYIAAGDPDVDIAVREWEPAAALFAGVDGLDDIRVIIGAAATWLAPRGWLVMEIGASQGRDVGLLLAGAGFEAIEIRADLAGHDRIAISQSKRAAS